MSLTTAIEAQTALLASELPLLRPAIDAGTAFPVSASTYTRFFREDTGQEYYFDGAIWQSVQEYTLHSNYLSSISAAQTMIATIPSAESIVITRVTWNHRVSFPNDASLYWSLTVMAGVGQAVCAMNTSSDTPSYFYENSLTTSINTPEKRIAFTLMKIGSVGLLLNAVAIAYRKTLA
jgi:hypothetical protein